VISQADLQALQSQVVALVKHLEAILERNEAERPVALVGECGHPADQRISVPRMGQPTAWLCRACGVEGETAAAAATKEG